MFLILPVSLFVFFIVLGRYAFRCIHLKRIGFFEIKDSNIILERPSQDVERYANKEYKNSDIS